MNSEINALPQQGQEADSILSSIRKMKESDAEWGNGRMFGYVYRSDDEAVGLMKELSHLYMFENALNASLFPSLAKYEREVVGIVGDLLNGDEQIGGSLTSGGTESIMLALKSARNHMRRQRPGNEKMEVILPWSVHPAFYKATETLGLKAVKLPLRDDYKADVGKIHEAINKNTIMIVASAPSYSHGVIDPIPEIAEIAVENDLLFHVDSCLGGLFLPFMEKLGQSVPLFDFRVPGVTSISADMHKYGYGIKGASVILYRSKEVWKDQFYVYCDWPGGMFGSPGMLGSRSGVPAAIAWAMLQYHGMDGYLKLTEETMKAVKLLKDGISAIDGLQIVADPVMSVFGFTSAHNDIYRIGDLLEAKGWNLDRIMYPESLHFIVTYPNLELINVFLADLEEATKQVRKGVLKSVTAGIGLKMANKLMKTFPKAASSLVASMASKSARDPDKSGAKGSATFYGIAASQDDRSKLDELVMEFLEGVYSPRSH